jgi:hypothetical protein
MRNIIADFRGLVETAEFDAYMGDAIGRPSDGVVAWRWLDIRVYAAWTIVRYKVGAALCARFGHVAEHHEFIACERDEHGRVTDIDGGGVDWFCPRCGQGGREWF